MDMRRLAPALLVALSCLAGCGEREPRMTIRKVEIARVPAPLLDAARKAWPDVDYAEAWSNHAPGQEAIHSYEIRGKTRAGKTREVRVAPDGTILEKE